MDFTTYIFTDRHYKVLEIRGCHDIFAANEIGEKLATARKDVVGVFRLEGISGMKFRDRKEHGQKEG